MPAIKMEWIAVKDGSPPENQHVLIACGDRAWMGYIDHGDWFNSDGDEVDHKVTHWMFIPKLPKKR